MIRIESTNPATSSNVNGVPFAPHPDPERKSKVSILVEESVADRFCAIPGYARCGALAPDVEAALEGALAKLAAGEEHGRAVTEAERTVEELQEANLALAAERDGLRRRVAELERVAAPEAATRLSGEVSRLTGEVTRLAGERDAALAAVQAGEATIAQLRAELDAGKAPKGDDAKTKDEKKSK